MNETTPQPSPTALRLVPLVSSRAPIAKPVALAPGVTFVGRTDENGIVLRSNLVSRRHAKLILTDLGLTVHDLDSHNGVFLNGKKVRSTPVHPGDVLYFGDVCVAVEALSSPRATLDVDSSLTKSNLVSEASSSGDDPAARNLAALLHVTDLLIGAGDDTFFVEALKACQTLTEATLSVLVRKKRDGALATPVVLRDSVQVSEEPALSWAVVRRAVDETTTLFSRDTATVPLVPDDILSTSDMGALICVPILVQGEAKGVLYFARPFAGEGFTDREVETLTAIAHLFAQRVRRPRPNDATALRALGETDEGGGGAGSDERADLDAELATLRDRLRTAEAELARKDDVERRLAEAVARASELEIALANARTEMARDAQSSIDNDGAITVLRAELDDKEATIARLESELSARDGALVAARADVAALGDRVAALEAAAASSDDRAGEAERARDALRASLDEARAAQQEAERVVTELQDTAREIDDQAATRTAKVLRRLPPGFRARVEHAVNDDAPDAVAHDDVTALVVALTGLDAWVGGAPPESVKQRLDRFAAIVSAAATEHGGLVEQVLGHAHLVTFPSSEDGAEHAVRCALAIVQRLPSDDVGGVHCGLHAGTRVQGFFGDDEPAFAQAGEAIAIARGTCEYARQGSVWLTERVRALVGDKPGMMFIATGPHLIREFRSNPINLFQLAVRA